MVPLCTPVLPRPHLSAKVVQARAARTSDRGSSKGRGNRWHHAHARTSTPPPFDGGRPSSGRRVQDRAKGTNCARPNSHAPTFRRGSSELQGDVHNGPGQRHDEAKGVMRGGDGSCGRSWKLKIGAGHRALAIYAPGYSPSRNVTWNIVRQKSVLFVSLYSHVHCRQSCKKNAGS